MQSQRALVAIRTDAFLKELEALSAKHALFLESEDHPLHSMQLVELAGSATDSRRVRGSVTYGSGRYWFHPRKGRK